MKTPPAGLAAVIDSDILDGFLSDTLGLTGPIELVRTLSGRSNETHFVTKGETRLVLRLPPRSGAKGSAHDLEREVRFYRALDPTDVPVPRVIAFYGDSDLLGRPFLLLEHVDGLNLTDEVAGASLRPEQAAAASRSVIDVLILLRSIKPPDSLSGTRDPQAFLERQLDLWPRQWHSVQEHGDDLLFERLTGALQAKLPAGDSPVTVVHGDYRLDNTILNASTMGVDALIDWEMGTVGDPRTDLGWLLAQWSEPGGDPRAELPIARRVTAHEGFLTRAQLLDRYATAGFDTADHAYFQAMACWKLAAIMRGIIVRDDLHREPRRVEPHHVDLTLSLGLNLVG